MAFLLRVLDYSLRFKRCNPFLIPASFFLVFCLQIRIDKMKEGIHSLIDIVRGANLRCSSVSGGTGHWFLLYVFFTHPMRIVLLRSI